MPPAKSTITLRSQSGEHQVDVCPPDTGFVLSTGAVSFWLTRAAAAEISRLLEHALALQSVQEGLPGVRN
jgi:hypothetical protein